MWYRAPERNIRQLPSQNMLKDLGYISQLSVFHTVLLNLVFYTSFFTLLLLSCIVLCAGCASNEPFNQLHRARLRKNQEARQIWVFSSLFLNLVEIDFLQLLITSRCKCTGHSAKKAHNRFRYRARLRGNQKILQILALSSIS